MSVLHLDIPRAERPFGGADVLAYYDGPLLMWLPHAQQRLLAIALPDEAGIWPFLVAQLDDDLASQLVGNRLTVRAAVLRATQHYFIHDYGAERLELRPLRVIPQEWLPGDVTLQP